MKIIPCRTSAPNIEVIEVIGELTGTAAMDLQEWFNSCLNEGKRCQVINLGRLTDIDGVGISILEDFVNRGMQIRLFNVDSKIRWMLKMSEKEDIFKIYNETDCDTAVSLFEKEILGEGEAN